LTPSSQTEFADLYEQCVAKLYPLCLRITENDKDADDALSQAFVSAMEHRADMPASAEERMFWLKRICINKAIDIVRQRRPERFVALEVSGTEDRANPLDEISVEGASPEELYAWKELLDRGITRLEHLERLALALVYQHGMRKREAAAALGQTQSYFYYYLTRAEKKLHDFMQEQAAHHNSAAGLLLTFWDRSASPEVRAKRQSPNQVVEGIT